MRRYGRPPLNLDWRKLADLVKRGASIRQIKDAMRLSHRESQSGSVRGQLILAFKFLGLIDPENRVLPVLPPLVSDAEPIR